MEDISLQTEIDKDKIAKVLGDLFPGLTVFHYRFGDEQPSGLDLEDPSHIFFHTTKKYAHQQFDVELRVYRTSSAYETERALFIAKKISNEFSVPALIRHSTFAVRGHEASLNNILFRDGKAFIVDEHVSAENDCVLPDFVFDAKGKYMGMAD